jgi:sugar O-acyltransferase (sialic acid O-acetyltransferase NeuD family)
MTNNSVVIKKVIGIGAGGHSRVVIDILSFNPEIHITGLVDNNPDLQNKEKFGLKILGSDSILPKLHARGVSYVFIGVGMVKDLEKRKKLYEQAQKNGFIVISAIHPKAIISGQAKIGKGVTIMAGAIINSGAVIKDNVIINTGAIIEHDCIINSHCHIAPGAVLSGEVKIDRQTFIGAGATIKQNISIGSNCIVGAGAVVTRNISADNVVAGVPAKVLP